MATTALVNQLVRESDVQGGSSALTNQLVRESVVVSNPNALVSQLVREAWVTLTVITNQLVREAWVPVATPILTVSPLALAFAGNQGGSNPSNQLVAISNGDGGTLNWTIALDQPWLGASPLLGTNAGTVSVSVNISNLAASTYAGTATVTATGAIGSPTVVNVTLVVGTPLPTPPSLGGRALTQVDTWELDNGMDNWPVETGTPQVWWETTLGQQQLGIAPAPSSPGGIGLLYVALAETLNGTGVQLAVPDDWAPYIIWGALGELLSSDGPAYDPLRAQYCTRRYEEGVELARLVIGG